MAQKKTINLAITQDLLGDFYDTCALYGHGKQKGMVLSAAILMFLESTPDDQADYMRKIISQDINAGVEAIRQRALGVAKSSAERTMPARAAKKAGKSKARRGVSKLPKLPGTENKGKSSKSKRS